MKHFEKINPRKRSTEVARICTTCDKKYKTKMHFSKMCPECISKSVKVRMANRKHTWKWYKST
jgi:Zn finger protein HypA/HybF involved in hydrogenase expression